MKTGSVRRKGGGGCLRTPGYTRVFTGDVGGAVVDVGGAVVDANGTVSSSER